MNLRKLLGCISAAAFAAVVVSTASAGPISVSNFSFETLPAGGLPFDSCGAGCFYSDDAIPGWAISGKTASTGQFQPGVQASNFSFFNSVPDGITVAYTNGGTISQTVGVTVALGIVYTLLVDQGVRHDFSDPGIVELLIGTTPIVATGVAASPGDWSTYTATYTGLAADVGKSIAILLNSSSIQGDWDNVRLDATDATAQVPEPATVALLSLGLAGLGFMRRKRNG